MSLLARTLIDHFVEPHNFYEGRDQVSLAAILTCCRPFLHSSIAPKILATEVDLPNVRYRGWLEHPLQSLLYTAETAQFSQALSVNEGTPTRVVESLLSDSRYLSRSLLRLRTRSTEKVSPEFWHLITNKVRCPNVEEIDTDNTQVFCCELFPEFQNWFLSNGKIFAISMQSAGFKLILSSRTECSRNISRQVESNCSVCMLVGGTTGDGDRASAKSTDCEAKMD